MPYRLININELPELLAVDPVQYIAIDIPDGASPTGYTTYKILSSLLIGAITNQSLQDTLAIGSTTGPSAIQISEPTAPLTFLDIPNLFKLELVQPTLSSDQVQTLQDKTGTIALLSDIAGNNELSEILANGNNTGGNDILVDEGDFIKLFKSGFSIRFTPPLTLTANRTVTFRDLGGVVAFTSELGQMNLNEVLVNCNETGGQKISISTGDVIQYNRGGFFGSLDVQNLTAVQTWYLPNLSGVIALRTQTAPTKSGKTLAVSFAGNPKIATVTFSTPFVDANYSPVLVCETIAGASYVPNVQNILPGSFDINMSVNNIPNLTAVYWTATRHGETL